MAETTCVSVTLLGVCPGCGTSSSTTVTVDRSPGSTVTGSTRCACASTVHLAGTAD